MSSSNVTNPVAFVRTSREFPPEVRELGREMNRGWIELANAINNRTISIFPTNRPAQNGESWFINNNQRQQGLRQVYTFTNTLADIPLGFKISNVNRFTNAYGSFTDGTNWYGAFYASNVAIAGQLTFFIFLNVASTTTDLIRFVPGVGSPVPAVGTIGTIVLEWLSQV